MQRRFNPHQTQRTGLAKVGAQNRALIEASDR
jgi:hypothetical protein